ncbi:MAG: asparaginase [Bacteroidetes bacterium]|nr:asparaginase [Bacteroidota bacterium]
MKRVVMIFTGGTISMTIDPVTGGAVPSLSGDQILARMDEVRELAEIEFREYGKHPGPHITPAMMQEIALLAASECARDDVEGVIITHGTDTLEETAYFLDLVLDTDKPVLLVGAMNHSEDPEWDGPANIRDAMLVVMSGQFRGLGVMTCLSGEINAASEVTKTHTLQRDTFMSFDFGPVGRIFEGRPVFLRRPFIHDHIGLATPVEPVHILKCYAGMDIIPFRSCVTGKVRGLVVEAMGTGNVPPLAFDGILEVLEAGIPVVLVSRCPRGVTDDVYGYYGAGRNLHAAGVIFAPYLNGQKARIKLMLALDRTAERQVLRRMFEHRE